MSGSISISATATTVAAAFAAAAHVTRLELRNNRIVVNAMEPRSAIAEYDPEQRHWTLHVGCQGVFGFRNYIAQVLGVGRDKVRVLTDRVGGSFGMKQPTYPEYYCILHAARELGRPVKWTDERSGSFVSDSHGRDHEMTAELALDRDGNFLAVRLTGYGNLGATYGAPGPATRNAVRNTLGVYRTPLIEVNDQMRLHQHDAGRRLSRRRPARGQLLHGAAGRHRRAPRWASTASSCAAATTSRPRRCRTRAPNGTTYDSGDFTALLDQALALADWDGFAGAPGREPGARQAARPRHRRLSRSDRAAGTRDGRHPLRARRRRDDHHRHARLRPGPRLAVRPGAGRPARHPVPAHPPAAGRQRRADRRRRHRRLQIDDRPAAPRSSRPATR